MKAQRTAQAVLRVLSFGSELRISVDGELLSSEVIGDVRASAREKRHAFEARAGAAAKANSLGFDVTPMLRAVGPSQSDTRDVVCRERARRDPVNYRK